MNPIDTILDEVIRREGVYVNHPADRVGPTNFGITAQTLGSWRKLGHPATAAELQALTEPEARAIYRQQYTTSPGFETVTHPALLHLLVDARVHSGPKGAVQWLQAALGIAADGASSVPRPAPHWLLLTKVCSTARCWGSACTISDG